jgi:hypothetical protein
MPVKAMHERGATAILIAISLLLLIGMAAVAIDIGAGKNERRLDQNTADASVMAAGVELMISGSVQEAVNAVKQYANTNLGRTVDQAEWTACADSEALPILSTVIPGVIGGSPCISFGNNSQGIAFAKVRVRVPNQSVPTTFGRVLGALSIETSAAAEADMDAVLNSGAFPSAIFANAQQGESFCIKTGTGSSNAASCGSPSSGDFGNFVPYFYTELAPGNPSTYCTSGNQPFPLSRVVADGLDHFLGTTPVIPGNRRNGADCPSFAGPAFPNRLDSGSGYSNSDITDGLIVGGNYDGPYTGRLTRKVWPSGTYGVANIFSFQVDNRPLWTYIDPSAAATGPAACSLAATGPTQNDGTNEADYILAQTRLTQCLSSNPPDGLFGADTDGVAGADIYLSPRLTIVPKYHQVLPIGNNSCCYDVKDFTPVFIEGVWTNNGPQWTCDGSMINVPGDYCQHEPGRTGTISITAAGQRKIDSASATVVSCEVLPGPEAPAERCNKIGTGGSTVTIFANLFLTR